MALAFLGASWLARRGTKDTSLRIGAIRVGDLGLGDLGIGRRRSGADTSWTAKALALAGFSIVGASGWLGGHLSYALGVGVDTTSFIPPPQDWSDACSAADLADGVPMAVTIDGLAVLLVRSGTQIHAIADRCTHRGGPLHEGQLVDGCIECPWHGSRFRLTDGAVERGPATRPQPRLETRIAGDRVQVRREESRALRANPA